MSDRSKTKQALIQELASLRERITELEQSESERKRLDDVLRLDSEILANMKEGVILIRVDESVIVYANLRFESMFGYDPGELVGKHVSIINAPGKKTPEDVANEIIISFNQVGVWYGEINNLRKDGTSFWCYAHVSKFKHQQYGEVWVAVHQDITERKRAEEQLYASIQEKELLLKELHHRVKNNMQVISGLLDLQARSSGNPELTEMLNESQNRIHAMSLVHEKLYGSKDFARIDLTGYVRTMSQDLFQSYKINPGKIDLIIQTDGDIYVDINKAIPCGLILNELISNALKHAFHGDRHGKLQIIIRETKNTEIEIVVLDNGLGLPDNVNIHQPRSAGLHLVNGLVKNQLDGQIEIKRDAGTEFRIKFPL